jgi:hypothetical protein
MKYVSYKMGNAHHSSPRVNLLVLGEELIGEVVIAVI